jgi:hypothetical protein
MPGLPPPPGGGVVPVPWTAPVQPTPQATSAAPIKILEEKCVTGIYLRQSDPKVLCQTDTPHVKGRASAESGSKKSYFFVSRPTFIGT